MRFGKSPPTNGGSRVQVLAKTGLSLTLCFTICQFSLAQAPAKTGTPEVLVIPPSDAKPVPSPSSTAPDEGRKAAPSETEKETAGAEDSDPSPWSKVPPVTPMPRPGWFLIPPSGPGYYSLKDRIVDNYRENPPKYPYPPTSIIPFSYYDVDYRFLEDPNNTQFDWSDFYKRIHIGDNWLLSIGGEERVRYQHEEGGYLRIHATDDDYTLLRSRLYMDLWFRDIFRVFVEFYDARVNGQDLPPNPIDVNHSDFLNLFGELKLWEFDDHGLYARVGRQELLYGSQRLISPLDWANTRRTFQGAKAYWHGENLDLDAFWVQPVVVDPTHFDSPDHNRQFLGEWTTYRPAKGQAIDLYYLYLDDVRPINVGEFGQKAGERTSTVGARYYGDYLHFLWDFEGMYQFGHWSNQEISAGAYTTGLGYAFADAPMNPQFWIYYDFASGDHNGGTSSEHGTFNQLFPFGHYYFGYLDLVGRQNISDLNLQFGFYPEKWIMTLIQYHIFRLDAARDALYNAGGTAIRRDPTGRAGTDVGDEIDFVTNFHLSQHQDIFLGYSKLFSGAFIKRTGPGVSPEFFYAQYCFKW